MDRTKKTAMLSEIKQITLNLSQVLQFLKRKLKDFTLTLWMKFVLLQRMQNAHFFQ